MLSQVLRDPVGQADSLPLAPSGKPPYGGWLPLAFPLTPQQLP